MDRYWAVTRVDYIHNRSARRILLMIGVSWGLALSISIPPFFIQNERVLNKTDDCSISQNLSYTVYSTIGAFYLPFIAMMIIYFKVFLAARARIRKKRFRESQRKMKTINRPPPIPPPTGKTTFGMEEPSKLSVENYVEVNAAAGDDEAHSPEEESSGGGLSGEGNDSGGDGSVGGESSKHVVKIPHDRLPLNGLVFSVDSRFAAHVVNCIQNDDANCSTPVVHTRSNPANDNTSNLKKFNSAHLSIPPPSCGVCHSDTESFQQASSPLADRSPDLQNLRGSWIDLTKQYLERKGPHEVSPKAKEKKAREKIEKRRERKAARTLAIITGSFCLCWLPFFIVAIVRPFCGDACYFPVPLLSVINWLGYFNSLLNPIIYTIFNPDFRLAFRKILFGKYRRQSKYRRAAVANKHAT